MAYIQALAKAIATQLSTIWTTSNRLPVDTGASANSVTIQDPTTSANKIAVNGTGQIGVSNQPTGFATESTLSSTKTSLENRLGNLTDAPANDINSSSGLSGLIRLLGKLIKDPSAVAASPTGTVGQQLRFIAENISGGTQYDSATTQVTPKGTIALARNASNVVNPLLLDNNGFLRIAIASGAPNSPTEYIDGASLTTPTGNVALGKRPDGTLNALPLSATGLLQITAPSAIPVNILSGGGGGTQYSDGASATTPTGTYALGNKSGVAKALQIDSNNYLQVSAPDITNKLGSVGDAANPTGTALQQFRWLCDNGGIRYGDGTTQASPFGSLALAKGTGANAGKVYGLQVDTNGYLQTTIPNAINIADFTTPANKLAINASGFITVANSSFASTQSGTWNINNISGAISLPTGASTETTLAALSAKIPAALVSGRLSVDGSGVTQPISATALGTIGDAPNISGSALAILRHLGDSLNRASITSVINITASGDTTVISATASKQIVITNLFFTVDATANITFKNGATAISGAMPISTFGSDDTRIILSTNTAFVINVSATANVRGFVTYYLM